MKYVEINERTGEVTWDAYFDYLRSVRGRLPEAVYSYASEWAHYSLDGANSLHDAWLISVQIGFRNAELTLEFMGPRHDRKHVFTYLGVEQYKFDLNVTCKQGDRDVLAHEFTVDDRCIVHEIMFSNRKSIVISTTNMLPRTDMLSSSQ